jgi:predicted N-formylglutamate amidohydrolase
MKMIFSVLPPLSEPIGNGMKPHLIISCEHGGNLIPAAWRGLFARHARQLLSHEGFDAGALTLARDLATAFDASLFYSKTSRLLVDLNRSLGHPRLFSPITRSLGPAGRQTILAREYFPYRKAIENHIALMRASDHAVIHLASHSFTPIWKDQARELDMGLLYDPARAPEQALCVAWQAALMRAAPMLKVRRNAPYKGASDGITAALRKLFEAPGYIGVEIEVNQKHVLQKNRHWPRLRSAIIHSLREALIEIGAFKP